MKDQLFERGLPSDTLSERMVIGSLMNGSGDFRLLADALSVDDFSLEKHRRIWARMLDLFERGVGIDRITVATELQNQGQLESIDGLTYLVSLDEGMPDLPSIDGYIDSVKQKSMLRRAIFTYQNAIEEAIVGGESAADILNRAQGAVGSLASKMEKGKLRSLVEVVEGEGGPGSFLNPSRERRGVPTPWESLNRRLEGGGMQGGQLITIGARPSLGKTALGCQMAIVAALSGKITAFVSVEMSEAAILRRMMYTEAQVDSFAHSRGYCSAEEQERLRETLVRLTDTDKLRLSGKLTSAPAIRNGLRSLAAKSGKIELIVVDYLQLMENVNRSNRSRTDEISEMSRSMKLTAEEFKCPLVLLSQLSRESEKENRAPRLSDLRDGGSIEQDSDIVLMPCRLPDQRDDASSWDMDLMIAKQRNGALGRLPMVFRRNFTRYEERLG